MLQFAQYNSLLTFLAVQCSLPSNCILFPPATPNCVVDVSPLECVYKGGRRGCDGKKSKELFSSQSFIN